jgi:peptidoglycan/LPS O-acetylase OafA/YrhL
MRRETSIYIDLFRILAAVAVFLVHAKRASITFGFLAPFGQFGEEAVAIFFVISGVVIAYVANSKEKSTISYTIARLSRLWSVVGPAVLLTIVLDTLGSRIAPELYDVPGLPSPWRFDMISALRAIAPLLFLHATWISLSPVGTNGPFWSLGYEAWYYLGFALFFFLHGRTRLLSIIVAIAVMGPSILGLAPLWMLGVAVFHRLGRGKPTILAWFVWVASGVGLFASLVFKYKILSVSSYLIFGDPGYSERMADVLPRYISAILFAINLVSFDRIGINFRNLIGWFAPSIRMLAGRSFSLYLYQAPLLFFFGACATKITWIPLHIAFVYVATLGSVFMLAEFTERRKDLVAGWLTGIFHKTNVFGLSQSR